MTHNHLGKEELEKVGKVIDWKSEEVKKIFPSEVGKEELENAGKCSVR